MLFKSFLFSAFLLTAASAHAADSSPLAKIALEKRAAAPVGSTTVIKTCKKAGTFALTFDDGPHELAVPIVSLLNKSKSKASFFVNGANFRCIYDHADEIIASFKAGHLIGSHTWGHLDVATLTAAQLNKQLTLVETALMKIIGVKPRFFRPPFGSINAAALKVLKARGYFTVIWDFDSGDSFTPALTAKQMMASYATLYKTFPKPHITLNHGSSSLGFEATALTINAEVKALTSGSVMPAVVPKLIAAGYKLVTVAECLGMEPYQVIGKPSTRDATWTCEGLPAPGVP